MAKTTSTDQKRQLRKLRVELRVREVEIENLKRLRESDKAYFDSRLKVAEDKLNDKEDKLLPAKQALLKELSFLVNATSRAVRTTMWSLAPEKRRGW